MEAIDKIELELKKRKVHSKESYEDIIRDLIEDQLSLKDEIVKEFDEGLQEYKAGKYLTLDDVFEQDGKD